MSYEFEAEPKVVHSRSKYRDAKAPEYGNQSTISGIGKENRPNILTPAQQEQEYVRIEKERMKIENMHKQLIAFKKSKKKVTPYEIKPSANPKVDVNLTFFLTDSTDVKPNQTNIDVQTDVFKPRPKSPPYVPKKTGRDVSTQVEDNELFNFDREVTPIIDVIVTKTLEQSVVEIEEETEIQRIRTFKGEYWQRRQEDEKKWRAMLQKELDTIATKNKKLEEFRAREERRIHILRKVQTYAVAHKYIRDLNFNTLEYLYNNGLHQNHPQEELINHIPPFMVEGALKVVTEKHKIRDLVANAFTQIEGELTSLRENADKRFKRKQEKRRLKRINYSNDERLVRFIYTDDGTPSTYFARFLAKMQEPELAAFFEDYRTRVNQLRDKLRHGDIAQDEYDLTFPADFPELQTPATFRLVLDGLKELSFNVANNMYYSEASKPGFFDIAISAFDKEGAFLYQVDKYMPNNTSKSVRYRGNVRDSTLRISDDLGIKVNLNKIEPEVSHLLLTVEIRNLEQSIAIMNELEHSRFRLADYNTGQTVEETSIFQNFKLDELKDTSAESELGGKILSYYLFKTPELGWIVEAVKTFKNVPIESFEQFNQNVLEPYLKICLDEEFKEFEETPDVSRSVQEPSIDKSRSKEYSKGKSSIVPSKIIESKREEEEDQPKGPQFSTRNFGPLHLTIADTVESIQEKVDEALKKGNEALYSSFEFGYQILVGEHELVRPTQIRKIGPVTSFLVKRKPKPVEDVVIQDTEEDGEDDEDKKSDETD